MERNILYAPDYVINSGGIIDIYYQAQGISDRQRLSTHVERIGETLTNIFQCSATQWQATNKIADAMAEAIFAPGAAGFKVA